MDNSWLRIFLLSRCLEIPKIKHLQLLVRRFDLKDEVYIRWPLEVGQMNCVPSGLESHRSAYSLRRMDAIIANKSAIVDVQVGSVIRVQNKQIFAWRLNPELPVVVDSEPLRALRASGYTQSQNLLANVQRVGINSSHCIQHAEISREKIGRVGQLVHVAAERVRSR